jgi:photosystem II stability/assembly factor-like uncharacterized protein
VIYSVAFAPTGTPRVLAGGDGLWWSPDGARHWARAAALPAVGVLDILVGGADPRVWYLGTTDGVVRTPDAGRTWQHARGGIPRNGQVNALVADPAAPGTVYAAVLGSGVFRTTDGGAHWEKRSNGLTSTVLNGLAISTSNPAVLYVATNAGVFRTVDGGGTWMQERDGFADVYIRDVAVDPTDADRAYACSNEGVYVTTDGGAHWTVSDTGLTDPVVQTLLVDPTDPATLYAGALSGRRGGVTDVGRAWPTSLEGRR